jgi:hypothetical protein
MSIEYRIVDPGANMKGKHGMEERIRELEGQLEAEETKIKALFLTAKIPTPDDYAERDRIRGELKTARRVKAMDANRTVPKKTGRFSILLPDDELEILTNRAEEKGVIFSSYIRHLLKIGLEVEDKGRIEGKSGG